MSNVKIIVGSVLIILAVLLYMRYESIVEKAERLEVEKNNLLQEVGSYEKEINEYNDKEKEAIREIQKLRVAVANHKMDECDCYNMPIPPSLLDAIRQAVKD